MYIKRHIEIALLQRAKERGAIVLTGARQVGKTTLIENIKPDITKVTFDDLTVRDRAIGDAAAFMQMNPPPIFIDEVQYAPEIFPYIKIALDKSKRKGDFFLTGSQKFELMKNASESLAGRAGILELLGLSLREMRKEDWYVPFLPTLDYLMERKKAKKELAIKELWPIIHRGSMPELFTNIDFDWQNYYSDYVKTYIERDVRKLTQVADEADFLKFMTACASMTGQLLNIASLARKVGISEPTAKRWLSILKTSGIIYLLKPYSNNAIKRAVKTPKLYFLDTGLAAYLLRWLSSETLFNGAMSGHFFETFVVSEILKSYTNAGRQEDFYFLRDGNGHEIDLLIFQDNTLFPLEIKQRTNPSLKDIKHFAMLGEIKEVKVGEGGVVCLSQDLLPLNEGFRIIPLWAI
ncbi:MAG: ATP-binding protein [Lachnospiraceae bacterium]|nr:ATP-binding protein [Lachnospiraceae bacterium]